MYDQDGGVVALIAEEITGVGNELQRQLLRTRRSFTSTVLTADGAGPQHGRRCGAARRAGRQGCGPGCLRPRP